MSVESIRIEGIDTPVSRIGLGTWAIGGWMWGGADDATSVETIRRAVESGINLIDTAPVYGFGHSEEVVGKALQGLRDKAVIATKAALEWSDAGIHRNASAARIRREVEDSLRRLKTDRIDLYQDSLAGPAGGARGNRRRTGAPAPRRQDPRHRREQLFAGTDGRVPPVRSAGQRAATLQPVRARHRRRRAALRRA
ncbi:oxidoreductase [Pseudomonas aeruginosa]|nr:oxidoreductase [Pseudomonas aeruginosa]